MYIYIYRYIYTYIHTYIYTYIYLRPKYLRNFCHTIQRAHTVLARSKEQWSGLLSLILSLICLISHI